MHKQVNVVAGDCVADCIKWAKKHRSNRAFSELHLCVKVVTSTAWAKK